MINIKVFYIYILAVQIMRKIATKQFSDFKTTFGKN